MLYALIGVNRSAPVTRDFRDVAGTDPAGVGG
jgi:hypothetical protein